MSLYHLLPWLKGTPAGRPAGALAPQASFRAADPGEGEPPADRPDAPLEMEVAPVSGGVVVRLKGEAGYGEVEALRARLLRVTARRPAVVVIDLSELTLLSSLAMGALVEFRRGVRRFGGRARLAAPQPQVWEAIEATGLCQLFDVFAGVEEALGARVRA